MINFAELRDRIAENIEKLEGLDKSTAKLTKATLRTLKQTRLIAQRKAKEWSQFADFVRDDAADAAANFQALAAVQDLKDFDKDNNVLYKTLCADAKQASYLQEFVAIRVRKLNNANDNASQTLLTSLKFYSESIQVAFHYLSKKEAKKQAEDKHQSRLNLLDEHATKLMNLIEQSTSQYQANKDKINRVWGEKAIKQDFKSRGRAKVKIESETITADASTPLLSGQSVFKQGNHATPQFETMPRQQSRCCGCFSLLRKR